MAERLTGSELSANIVFLPGPARCCKIESPSWGTSGTEGEGVFRLFRRGEGPALSIIPPIKSITTVGDWGLVFHLGAPNPEMPYMLSEASSAAFIISPKAIEDPKALGTQTDGAGPYVAVPAQSIPGSVYTFTPNPYFYDQSAIHFSTVVVKIISQPRTRARTGGR